MHEFSKKRILIIAPHNDDEVIGCWHFMEAVSELADIEIAFVTHAQNDQGLTQRRREESTKALSPMMMVQSRLQGRLWTTRWQC